MCCLPKDAAFFIKPLNFCNFGPQPCLYLLLYPWPCRYLHGLPAPVNTSDYMMFTSFCPITLIVLGLRLKLLIDLMHHLFFVSSFLIPQLTLVEAGTVSFVETLLLEFLIHSTFVLVLMLLIVIQERPTPSCRNYR